MTESTDKQLPDEQLDEYLKGDSSVSRQYRQLHSIEVPAELDRFVLRQAEDAVKTRPAEDRAVKRPAWVRWSAPLALAASAVLVLSVVIETGMQDETMQLQAPEAVRPAAPPSVQLDMPPPPTVHPAEPTVEVPEAIAQGRRSPLPAAAPAAATASGQAVAKAAGDAERELQAASAAARTERKEGSAFAAEATREETRSAAAQRTMRIEQNQESARDTVATPSTPAEAYSRQISVEMPTPPRTYSDPEAWLKDIRQLREENKQEEADREWRRFRAAFPKYEVAETDIARETQNSQEEVTDDSGE